MPPPPLHPTSFIARHLADAHTLIRVRNLTSTVPLPIGTDAWGRAGRPQPVLVSVTASLRRPFGSASQADRVTGATVHYGVLSKAILEICESWAGAGAEAGKSGVKRDDGAGPGRDGRVQAFLDGLFDGLLNGKGDGKGKGKEPVIPEGLLRSLEITVTLPKASLIGEGISVSDLRTFGDATEMEGGEGKDEAGAAAALRGSVLKIHELRIPTLIGVNPNERLAKQIVVANVTLDPWGLTRDVYCELEEIVVKTIEESSFQTLEALATHLSSHIIKYFLTPLYHQLHQEDGDRAPAHYPRLRISLEKPTAVTFASAPVIEILVDEDFRSSSARRDGDGEVLAPPFPLQGRLMSGLRGREVVGGEIGAGGGVW